MGRIIEGVWDCTYCDAKKIRGGIRQCPVCGRWRDDNITFYMDDPHNYVSDETAKNLNKNPDWLCSFCDGLNSDSVSVCENCGATREESELNYFTNKEKKEKERLEQLKEENSSYEEIENNENYNEDKNQEIEKTYDTYSSYENNSDNTFNSETHNDDYSNKTVKHSMLSDFSLRGLLTGIGGILSAILLVLGLVWLFSPKTQEVTIQSFEWQRSIDVEEYKTVEEDDWKLPDGGRLLYTKEEIKTYVRVIDHYETKTRTYTEQVFDHYEEQVTGHRDLGNGHFEEITTQVPVYRTETKTETYEEPVYRNDPVYATKYYYEIDKWVHKEYVKTSAKDQNPVWGTYEYKENEREGNKTEKYTVVVKTKKDKIKEYELNFDEWNSLKVGQTVTMKTYIGGKAELILDGNKKK